MNHMSLKDVAARVGVTFPTVNKVLKGKGTVSPETRIALEQCVDGCILIAPHLEREAEICAVLYGRVPVACTHCLVDDTFSMMNPDEIPYRG